MRWQVRAEPNSADATLTALCRACESRHLEVASLLLEHGARVGDVAPSGVTALHCAARAGPRRLCQMLLDAKADPLRAHATEGTLPVEKIVTFRTQVAVSGLPYASRLPPTCCTIAMNCLPNYRRFVGVVGRARASLRRDALRRGMHGLPHEAWRRAQVVAATLLRGALRGFDAAPASLLCRREPHPPARRLRAEPSSHRPIPLPQLPARTAEHARLVGRMHAGTAPSTCASFRRTPSVRPHKIATSRAARRARWRTHACLLIASYVPFDCLLTARRARVACSVNIVAFTAPSTADMASRRAHAGGVLLRHRRLGARIRLPGGLN